MRGTVAKKSRKEHLLVEKKDYMFARKLVKKIRTFEINPQGEMKEVIVDRFVVTNTTKTAYNQAKKEHKRK